MGIEKAFPKMKKSEIKENTEDSADENKMLH